VRAVPFSSAPLETPAEAPSVNSLR
jgi:hypothetical protein